MWSAWTEPAQFEQWWIPAPARCEVVELDLRPGGAFVPHMNACFLVVDAGERIVFTDALAGGWRPAERPFMTAMITLRDHPVATDYVATDYVAHVMHRSTADRDMHDKLGFHDGWGTVLEQLATFLDRRS